MKTWSQHRYEVKAHAKRSLVGNFLKCAFALTISFSLSLIALSFLPFRLPTAPTSDMTPEQLMAQILPNGFTNEIMLLLGIVLILQLLLTSPLRIGIWRFLLLCSRGEKPKFRVIFSSFLSLKEVFTALFLDITIVILQAFWALLLFAVPFALTALSPILGPLAQMSGDLLLIVAAILFAIVCVPYKLAPIVLAEFREYSIFKALRIARKKAKGVKREFFVFDLSFILWRLFTFSFPSVCFVQPYIDMSTVRFYDTIDECK